MKKIVLLIISIILTVTIIFIIKTYNSNKIGNNINNLKDYILNISSYEATIEVQVKSNKNENKYIIFQKYISPNQYYQEVLEPESIKNLKTIYDGVNLKIENANINLSMLYENYKYVGENNLLLNSFIKDYQETENSNCEENNETLIMKTKTNNIYKTLYIDKKTAQPTKMEIKDVNQNVLVYILYTEIKINNLNQKDIVAFKLEEDLTDI